MARFRLKEGSRPEDIGKIILDAAYARALDPEAPTDTTIAEQLREHLDATKETPPAVELHFDSSEVLHFVIPFLGSMENLKPPPGPGEPGSHLAKIAYEAMGTIVIKGCGK